MVDYTLDLPPHKTKYVGQHDLYLEIYGEESNSQRPSLLLVHGAYTGSWMWSKYVPQLVQSGWVCYVMNLRGHYRSRAVDLTNVKFQDYVDDLTLILKQCKQPPIIVGFSLGGILCQKIAETHAIAGLICLDATLSKEVCEIVPYKSRGDNNLDIVEPAPKREMIETIDESMNDIAFQIKYNGMESSLVFSEIGNWMKEIEGISINHDLITCPTLIIRSISKEEHALRGIAEASYLHGRFVGCEHITHTGLLIGQKYQVALQEIETWLKEFY